MWTVPNLGCCQGSDPSTAAVVYLWGCHSQTAGGVIPRTPAFSESSCPGNPLSLEFSAFTNPAKMLPGASDGRVQFSSDVSCVQLFVTPWTAAHQASLSITNSQSLLKLMSIESVMPSNHLILCQPLLLLPSIFASIRVFSKESVLHIRKPKYWSFSFSVSSSNEYSGLTSLISLQSKGLFIYLLFFFIYFY